MEVPFSSKTVARLVRISYRQLDLWVRTGLVEPQVPASGSGSRRQWSFVDTLGMRIIKELLDSGVTLQRVRRILEVRVAEIRRFDGALAPALEELLDLLTRGRLLGALDRGDALDDVVDVGTRIGAVLAVASAQIGRDGDVLAHAHRLGRAGQRAGDAPVASSRVDFDSVFARRHSTVSAPGCEGPAGVAR